jgi:hypothetical protein
MNLIRKGASFVVIATQNHAKTVSELETALNPVKIIHYSDHFYEKFETLSGFSGPNMCVLLFTNTIKPLLTFENHDFQSIMLVDMELSSLLVYLLNNKDHTLITGVRVSPQLIIMKTVGEAAKYIERVTQDFDGVPGSPSDIFERYANGTILVFTDDLLKRAVPFNRLHPQAYFTPNTPHDVLAKLIFNRMKYVNTAIDHSKWTEVTIKIYDIYEQYDLHYRRVRQILDHSDLGLVIHEGWGKDTVRPLMSVGVYTLTFITFKDPSEVKHLMQGIEYNQNNDRIVDIDCYVNKNKIPWFVNRTSKKQTKKELAKESRPLCLALLDDDEVVEFLSVEHLITEGQT